MNHISPLNRISLALAATTVSLLVLAHSLGFVPDYQQMREIELQSRRDLAESVAIQLSLSAERSDWLAIRSLLDALVKRNPRLLAISLRNHLGKTLATTNRSDVLAITAASEGNRNSITVPIFRNNRPWGEAQFRFASDSRGAGPAWFGTSLLPLVTLVGSACFLAFNYYLRRVLTKLAPSAEMSSGGQIRPPGQN